LQSSRAEKGKTFGLLVWEGWKALRPRKRKGRQCFCCRPARSLSPAPFLDDSARSTGISSATPFSGATYALPPIWQAGSAHARPAIAGSQACERSKVRHLSFVRFRTGPPTSARSVGSFAACLVIWQDEIDVAHTQCARKFKEGHDGRISPASLQIADILLGEAGGFGKTLLCEAFFLP
jgi:hypothetical protein